MLKKTIAQRAIFAKSIDQCERRVIKSEKVTTAVWQSPCKTECRPAVIMSGGELFSDFVFKERFRGNNNRLKKKKGIYIMPY